MYARWIRGWSPSWRVSNHLGAKGTVPMQSDLRRHNDDAISIPTTMLILKTRNSIGYNAERGGDRTEDPPANPLLTGLRCVTRSPCSLTEIRNLTPASITGAVVQPERQANALALVLSPFTVP